MGGVVDEIWQTKSKEYELSAANNSIHEANCLKEKDWRLSKEILLILGRSVRYSK